MVHTGDISPSVRSNLGKPLPNCIMQERPSTPEGMPNASALTSDSALRVCFKAEVRDAGHKNFKPKQFVKSDRSIKIRDIMLMCLYERWLTLSLL